MSNVKFKCCFIKQLEAEIMEFQSKAKEVAAKFAGIEETRVADNFSNPEEEIEM